MDSTQDRHRTAGHRQEQISVSGEAFVRLGLTYWGRSSKVEDCTDCQPGDEWDKDLLCQPAGCMLLCPHHGGGHGSCLKVGPMAYNRGMTEDTGRGSQEETEVARTGILTPSIVYI